MAISLKDRVRQLVTSSGVTPFSGFQSLVGFQNFSKVGGGNQTYYVLEEAENFEIGIGTYTSASDSVTRDTVLVSTNSNNAIILSGSATGFVTYPAGRAIFGDSGNIVDVSGLRFSGTGAGETAITLQPVSNPTSGISLSFEGSAGQLLSVTDNLSTGTIFAVNDIGGASLISADASGDVRLIEQGRYLGIANTSPAYQLDVSGTGSFSSAIRFGDGTLQTTAHTGDINTLSGLITTNTTQIAKNTGDIATVSGLTVTNASQIATNTGDIAIVSGLTATNTTNIASTGASNYNLIRSYIDTSGDATFNNVFTQGNLTVSGTLTYIDSTTVTIADKQLELASNSGTPIGNDAAVNDGGIVLKSTDSDKKWTWLDATDAWTSTENVAVTGLMIAGTGITLQRNTPGTTTDKLYNVGGSLYFNGAEVGGGVPAATGARIEANTAQIAINTGDIATVSGLIGSTTGTPSGVAFFNASSGIDTNATGLAYNINNNILRLSNSGVGEYVDIGFNSNSFLINSVANGGTARNLAFAEDGTQFFYMDAASNSLRVAGNLYPTSADSKNLGWTSLRWQNIYSEQLNLESSDTTDVNITVKAAASQSANLAEFQNSAGAVQAKVDSAGNIESTGNITASGTLFATNVQGSATTLNIYNGSKANRIQMGASDTTFYQVARFQDEIRPDSDNASDAFCGTSTYRWAASHVMTGVFYEEIDASGTVSATGLVTAATGVTLQRNTPATTTDKLYNVAGSLYFNGSEVGGGVPAATGVKIDNNTTQIAINTGDIATVSGLISTTTGTPSGIAFFGTDSGITDNGLGFAYHQATNTLSSTADLNIKAAAIYMDMNDTTSNSTARWRQDGSVFDFYTLNTNAGPYIRIGGKTPGTSKAVRLHFFETSSQYTFRFGDKDGVIKTYFGMDGAASQDKHWVMAADGGIGFSASATPTYPDTLLRRTESGNLGIYSSNATAAGSIGLGGLKVGDITASGQVMIDGQTASEVGLTVQGASSQSANLVDFENSAGTVLAHVGSDGAIATSGLVTAATGVTLQRNTPAATTDTLYNVAGDLYFNGSEVGGGGGSSTVSGCSDTNVVDPANGHLLIYDQSSAKWDNATLTSSGGTINITNGAGTINIDTAGGGPSDERLKTNIQTLKNALEKLEQLQAIEFEWNEEAKKVYNKEGHDIGLIAQEVEKVMPEAVFEHDGYKRMHYEKIVPLLIEALKELKDEVQSLKEQLKS